MSNKLKKEEKVDKIENKVKLSILDIALSLILLIAAGLIYPYKINIIDTNILKIVVAMGLMVFLIFTIWCGRRQNKYENNKVNVATVLKDRDNYKLNTSKRDRVVNNINKLLRTCTLINASFILNDVTAIVVIIVSLILEIVLAIMNKYKLVDIAYTAYMIGLIAFCSILIIY